MGAAYSPDGTQAYVAGGGFEVVHTFSVGAGGLLSKTGDIQIGTLEQNPFPTGLSVSPDGSQLAVANNLANTLDLIDLKSRQIIAAIPLGHYPYGALFSHDGRKVYVSNWGDASLSVVGTAERAVTGTIKVGNHPNAMIWTPRGELVVADANSDAGSIVDPNSSREAKRISVSPYRDAQLSSSPQGLAVSQGGSRLYVADGGSDEVTVIQLAENDARKDESEGGAKVLGRIPTAWYPTSVTVSRDGSQLYVTNAKGNGAGPNDGLLAPNPTRTSVPFQDGVGGYADHYCNGSFDQFTASMIVGTLSTISVPSTQRLEISIPTRSLATITTATSPFCGAHQAARSRVRAARPQSST